MSEHKKDKTKFLIALILSVMFLGVALGLTFSLAIPHYLKSKDFEKTECLITNWEINQIIDENSKGCAYYNHDVFWYEIWGGSPFFDQYCPRPSTGEYGNSAENEEDDGAGEDDDGGAGGEDGHLAFDGEVALRERPLLDKSQLTGNGFTSTRSARSLKSSDDYCFQGLVIVTYNESQLIQQSNMTVYGLFSSDYLWALGSATEYTPGTIHTCYFNKKDYTQLIWFDPPTYSGLILALIIIFSVAWFISLMVAIFIFKHLKNHGYHPIK